MTTPANSIGCFFLDSGAFSLYSMHAYKKTGKDKYAFYKTDEYWKFVDRYAKFVKKFGWAMDYYANVDVIFNPELSWKTLKYLEDTHGLKPVPVLHALTPLSWVEKHLEAGYEYIGIGGTGHKTPKEVYCRWANDVFALICPASKGYKPQVRTHGFAMTSWSMLRRYPWWSVDSASWVKAAAFGSIYVPRKTGGTFNFDTAPMQLHVSGESPSRKEKGKHITTLSPGERDIMLEWLTQIGIPIGGAFGGKSGLIFKPDDKKDGVATHYKPRALANLIYFEQMSRSMPQYPWAWKPVQSQQGLGIF
jgi:hypothetical protein